MFTHTLIGKQVIVIAFNVQFVGMVWTLKRIIIFRRSRACDQLPEPPRVATVTRGKRPAVAATPPARSPAAALSPPALPVPLPAKSEQAAVLAHAAKGVEALGVLVQYLVFRLDTLNGGGWRAEAARWRGLAAAERSSAARADLDRQQRAQKDFDTSQCSLITTQLTRRRFAECLNKISELEREVSAKDEANARLQAAGAAAAARYRATLDEIAGLATDIKGLKSTIESLKHEVAESRARLHAQGERERALRAQLEAARAELMRERDRATYELRAQLEVSRVELERERDDNTCLFEVHNGHCGPEPALPNGSHCDALLENGLQLNPNAELSKDANELAAEVRSLRAVLELKQAEAVSLRSARTELAAERERSTVLDREVRAARHAAEELRERAAARQRESDRLRDDNRRLREAAARDREQSARLAAQNEELRYKLRQKSQVVSLLAGGGYIERTLRTRTTSGDSARSPSPPPDSPPSPAASPSPDNPALPAVKGVVEKHDSVSWVLEIEDSPEEVASRLARRSSFRTSAASSSGVKRRGGGSPGSGSPAPASPAPNASKLFRPGELDFPPVPPPLKESAGEAIYIYDDRQY
ncbi:hypothetical protein EVAR_81974_1 [Eumeta japonica]|uniref:Uncharacterized protein n=1 Tax=Eumeta variegata TaxID=151549 RepID=A0A4C1VX61_EUMVA|nr:hypothetical protein EVAR_81974_1 [Eumeta japonica]